MAEKEKKEAPKTYTIDAKYKLSEEDKKEMSQRLANRNLEYDSVEQERKSRMSSFKYQQDEILAEINTLSQAIKSGYEYRKFRCTRELDFKKKLRIYKDADTGEVVDTKPIEPEDYQATML